MGMGEVFGDVPQSLTLSLALVMINSSLLAEDVFVSVMSFTTRQKKVGKMMHALVAQREIASVTSSKAWKAGLLITTCSGSSRK